MGASYNAPLSVTPDLSSMTKTQLLDYAEQTGVTGVRSSMTKAQIVAAIEGAEE